MAPKRKAAKELYNAVRQRARLEYLMDRVNVLENFDLRGQDDEIHSNEEPSGDEMPVAVVNRVEQDAESVMDCDWDDDFSLNPSASDDELAFIPSIAGSSDSNTSISSISSLESESDSSEQGSGGGDNVTPDDDDVRANYVHELLKEWSLRGVNAVKVDGLLKGLHSIYPNLPLTYRGLLSTPREVQFEIMGDGNYWYFGINRSLQQRLTRKYLRKYREVVIDLGADGLEIFGSCHDQFWPIMGRLVSESEPLLISIWCGEGKPPPQEFLTEFINEWRHLKETGIEFEAKVYPFRVRNFTMDAVARSYFRCTVGHTSRWGCEKCEVMGQSYRRRVVLLNMNAPLRTNESFRNRSDPRHHQINQVSALEAIEDFDMVNQVPLDSLHAVYEGAFKRWLMFVVGKKKKTRGLISAAMKSALSRAIDDLSPYIPSEFNRKLRNLKYMAKYKATELRRLLLYVGLKVFKELDPALYKSYLLLHNAIYILCDVELVQSEAMLNMADMLLREFVAHSPLIFGAHFVVFYVHNLIHLASECARNGDLDSFSAFIFENFLGVMKRALRTKSRPLAQIIKRHSERNGRLTKRDKHKNRIKLMRKHDTWPNIEGEQYHKLVKGSSLILSTDDCDCCFLSTDNEVVMIINIICKPNDKVILMGHKFRRLKNYFEFPVPSKDLGISLASQLEDRVRRWELGQVKRKCFLVPEEGGRYLCVPLLHDC